MKDKVSIPMEEQELHINFCPAEMGKNCEVYSTIPWIMKYLEKMVNTYPDDCKLIKDDQYSYTAQIPFKLVKPRAPRTQSEKQKEQARQNLAIMRSKRAK